MFGVRNVSSSLSIDNVTNKSYFFNCSGDIILSKKSFFSTTVFLLVISFMTVFINGLRTEVPNCKTTSWQDDPQKIKQINKSNQRQTFVKAIVCHTHKGITGNLLSGMGPNSSMDETLARYQINTDRQVSWDWTVDKNGDIIWQNDPSQRYSWQAGVVNGHTCGFEMIQEENGDQWESCIKASVLMIDFVTAKLGIQRQIPWNHEKNEPDLKIIKRLLADHGGGRDVVGIYGHCNVTTNRGPGDPNKYLFIALKEAGYLLFDYNKKEDLEFWKDKQRTLLGIREAQIDGIAGPGTRDLLKQKGYPHGMFVSRPSDSLIK